MSFARIRMASQLSNELLEASEGEGGGGQDVEVLEVRQPRESFEIVIGNILAIEAEVLELRGCHGDSHDIVQGHHLVLHENLSQLREVTDGFDKAGMSGVIDISNLLVAGNDGKLLETRLVKEGGIEPFGDLGCPSLQGGEPNARAFKHLGEQTGCVGQAEDFEAETGTCSPAATGLLHRIRLAFQIPNQCHEGQKGTQETATRDFCSRVEGPAIAKRDPGHKGSTVSEPWHARLWPRGSGPNVVQADDSKRLCNGS